MRLRRGRRRQRLHLQPARDGAAAVLRAELQLHVRRVRPDAAESEIRAADRVRGRGHSQSSGGVQGHGAGRTTAVGVATDGQERTKGSGVQGMSRMLSRRGGGR